MLHDTSSVHEHLPLFNLSPRCVDKPGMAVKMRKINHCKMIKFRTLYRVVSRRAW